MQIKIDYTFNVGHFTVKHPKVTKKLREFCLFEARIC